MAAAAAGHEVLLYIAAHGGIQDKDKRTLRRPGEQVAGPPDYGGVTVDVYSPIGTEYTSVLSSQIGNSGWTNITLTPSLICDIVRRDQLPTPSTSESIRDKFLKLQRNVQKLNTVSGIKYRDGDCIEKNPTEQHNYYIMPAADERYTRYDDLEYKSHRSNPARLAVPGDVVSFNYGVFIVDTTYPGVDLFSIKKNVSKFECISKEDQRKGVTEDLLRTLRDWNIMNCIVDPFDDPATPEARRTFKSCDLFKAGNSGTLMELIKRNCRDRTLLHDKAQIALDNLYTTDDKEITLEGIICILRAIIPGLTCVKILDHSCRGLDTMILPTGPITAPLNRPDTPPIIHENELNDTSDESSRPGTPITPGGSSRKRTKKRQHKRRKTQTRKHKKKTRRRNNRR